MKRALVVLLLAGFLVPSPAMPDDVVSVAYVYTPGPQTLASLQAFDVVFDEPDRPGWSRITTSRDTVDELRRAGFEVEVAIDDLRRYVESRNESIRRAPPAEPPVDVVLDHYLTPDETEAFVYELQAAYPDLVSVEVIGQSALGHDMLLVKVSDHVTLNEAEPAFFFENSIHGDEIAAYSLGLFMIEALATEYGSDPVITDLVDSREFFFVAMTNPDGTIDDPYWGRSRTNANGVDLNRDFGYMWKRLSYGPAFPQEEPELQALEDILTRDQPFMLSESGHGGAVIYIYPWVYKFGFPPDIAESRFLGNGYCQRCGYVGFDFAEGVFGVGQTFNSSMDEYYGAHGVSAFGLELTPGKEVTWDTTEQVFVDHWPSFAWVFQEMGNGLHGLVTDATTGDPVAAIVAVEDRWVTFSDANVGDFHKYLRPGAYAVRIFANGYADAVTNVTIAADQPTELEIELTPSAQPATFVFRLLSCSLSNAGFSADVLGRPDAKALTLGGQGFLTVDLGPQGIADAAGNDLAVYLAASGTSYEVFGGDDWNGPWLSIGTAADTAEFDLADAGIAFLRYARIEGHVALDAIGTPGYTADDDDDNDDNNDDNNDDDNNDDNDDNNDNNDDSDDDDDDNDDNDNTAPAGGDDDDDRGCGC